MEPLDPLGRAAPADLHRRVRHLRDLVVAQRESADYGPHGKDGDVAALPDGPVVSAEFHVRQVESQLQELRPAPDSPVMDARQLSRAGHAGDPDESRRFVGDEQEVVFSGQHLEDDAEEVPGPFRTVVQLQLQRHPARELHVGEGIAEGAGPSRDDERAVQDDGARAEDRLEVPSLRRTVEGVPQVDLVGVQLSVRVQLPDAVTQPLHRGDQVPVSPLQPLGPSEEPLGGVVRLPAGGQEAGLVELPCVPRIGGGLEDQRQERPGQPVELQRDVLAERLQDDPAAVEPAEPHPSDALQPVGPTRDGALPGQLLEALFPLGELLLLLVGFGVDRLESLRESFRSRPLSFFDPAPERVREMYRRQIPDVFLRRGLDPGVGSGEVLFQSFFRRAGIAAFREVRSVLAGSLSQPDQEIDLLEPLLHVAADAAAQVQPVGILPTREDILRVGRFALLQERVRSLPERVELLAAGLVRPLFELLDLFPGDRFGRGSLRRLEEPLPFSVPPFQVVGPGFLEIQETLRPFRGGQGAGRGPFGRRGFRACEAGEEQQARRQADGEEDPEGEKDDLRDGAQTASRPGRTHDLCGAVPDNYSTPSHAAERGPGNS